MQQQWRPLASNLLQPAGIAPLLLCFADELVAAVEAEDDDDGPSSGSTCTLWDDHVGKIEPFFNASSHDPVVVILQFCRIRTDVTNGEVRLCSSYDVTQVFINQQSQEFLEFRESLSLCGVQTPMRSIASFPSLNYERMMEQTESPAQDMKTIDEIYQTREPSIESTQITLPLKSTDCREAMNKLSKIKLLLRDKGVANFEVSSQEVASTPTGDGEQEYCRERHTLRNEAQCLMSERS
nr:uncharacterized protein LOC109153635 isoform X3 [Ipomoea trifida]